MLLIKKEVVDSLNNNFNRNCKLQNIRQKTRVFLTEQDIKNFLLSLNILDGEISNKYLSEIFKNISVEPDFLDKNDKYYNFLVVPHISFELKGGV